MVRNEQAQNSRSTEAVRPDVREAIGRIRQLAQRRPELSSIALLYEQLLPVLFAPECAARLKELSKDRWREKLAQGVPLLRGETMEFGEPAIQESWQELCAIANRYRANQSPTQSAAALAIQRKSPVESLGKVLNSGPEEWSKESGHAWTDFGFLMSVLRLWALPRLEPLVHSLAANWLRAGWPHGHCPGCGSWPLLAESRGLEQFRWLRCGLCGSGWQVDRIYCPFCESRDHRKLQDLFVEGEEQRLRVSVCDGCRGFVRGISTLSPLSAPALFAADLETFHLQLVAEARGYLAEPSVSLQDAERKDTSK